VPADPLLFAHPNSTDGPANWQLER